MEDWLKLWHAQIKYLEARTKSAGSQASFNLYQRIDEIKAMCAVLEARLENLNTVRT
ncbi:MAG: hypothetical protein SGI90_10600 [Candidatus Eisenbacteria bacterium]|nr:hypothetical protein [Candidatus Eisenbacteria bacterium]